MKSTQTEKPSRVLVIRSERDGGYGHIKGRVSHESSEQCGFKDQTYGNDADITKVVINSQCDDHSMKIYGEEIAYDTYHSIDMHEAKKAVATLSPILRKLDKMRDAEGYAPSFGAFVNRVARAVGASKVIIATDAETRKHTGNVWRTHTVGESVFAVDRMVDALIAELNPHTLKAAA